MAKTYEELLAGATQIKNNELPESNTHSLVGGQMVDMVEKNKDDKDKSDKKFTELELKINPLSNNQKINDTIREMYTSENLSDVTFMQISKAVLYNGRYNNIIRLVNSDNSYIFFLNQSFATKEDALAELKSFYNSNGNYCVIDWSKLEDGEDIYKQIILNSIRINTLEFNPYIAGYIQGNTIKYSINDFEKYVYTPKYIDIQTNGYITNTGRVASDTSGKSKHSERIAVGKGYTLEYSTRISSGGCALAFYDDSDSFIDDLKVLGTDAVQSGTYNVEDDRVRSVIISQYSYPSAYLYVSVKGNIVDRISKLESQSSNSQEGSLVQLEGVSRCKKPTEDINHFIIYGQSLSTGQQTCPELSRTNYRGNLMVGQYEWLSGVGSNNMDAFYDLKAVSLNGTDYIPTGVNDQTNGETPNINFANASKRLLDNYLLGLADRKILATSCGVGGMSIELLSKNCPNNGGSIYTRFINAVKKCKELANTGSKTISCSAIIWMQGEYNAAAKEEQGWTSGTNATSNKDDYKAYLIGGNTSDGVSHNGLINDMISDIKNVYNQEDSPIVFSSQIGPNFNTSFDNPIDMALLEVNNESENFLLVAPSYCVTDRRAHLDPNGTRWIGEYYAKAWFKKVVLGLNWKPLQPNKIEKYDNYLMITFDVPEPPIVFDTKTVRAVSNYGFKIKDDGTDVDIQSVEIMGPDTVKITCNSNFTSYVEVSYASNEAVYGNLRDSDRWMSFEQYKNLDEIIEKPEGVSYKPIYEPTDENGNVIYNKNYPCYNFCMRFYYKILSSEHILIIKTK